MQALHLAAALILLREKVTAGHVFRVAVDQFRLLDAESCRRVVPYLDSLPKELEVPLGVAISNIGIGLRTLKRVPVPGDSQRVQSEPTRIMYSDVLASLERAREALSAAVGNGHTIEDVGQGAAALATQFRNEANDELKARLAENQAQPTV